MSEAQGSAKGIVPTAEIELKLLGDREDLADLAGSPTIARYARDAGNHADLIATYYDTPDRRRLKRPARRPDGPTSWWPT